MPAGAYGDNIGGMTIAGGVAAALYRRATTGEPSVLDVSLLAVGAWATQFSVNMAMLVEGRLPKAEHKTAAPGNPLTGAYRTSDGRFIQLSMLQPTKYWPQFCTMMGLDEYAHDSRFATLEDMFTHSDAAYEIVCTAIGRLSFDECKKRLGRGTGQWAPVQDAWDVANDESLIANGRIAEIIDAEGITRTIGQQSGQIRRRIGRDDPRPAVRRTHRRSDQRTRRRRRPPHRTEDRRGHHVTAVPISPIDDGTVRDRLVRAADAEIAERGIESIQMEAVAIRAGVSRATAFRQLGNVSEMLVQVALLRSRRHTAAVEALMAKKAGVFNRSRPRSFTPPVNFRPILRSRR